jgi:hypothetical protein
MSSVAALSGSLEFLQKLSDLEEKLRAAAPGYEQLLYIIHKQLSSDEQLLHLLTDEQIGVIVAGLTKRKNIILADIGKKATANTKIGGKKLKDFTLDDLM